jgi:hypothetical protein
METQIDHRKTKGSAANQRAHTGWCVGGILIALYNLVTDILPIVYTTILNKQHCRIPPRGSRVYKKYDTAGICQFLNNNR